MHCKPLLSHPLLVISVLHINGFPNPLLCKFTSFIFGDIYTCNTLFHSLIENCQCYLEIDLGRI